MKYVDYKAKQHKEFNKLPMKAAFGDKQFEEMMAEWGLTTSKEDLEKYVPSVPVLIASKRTTTCS
jgi:hypothetical protein